MTEQQKDPIPPWVKWAAVGAVAVWAIIAGIVVIVIKTGGG